MIFEMNIGDAFGEFVYARNANFEAACDAFPRQTVHAGGDFHFLSTDAVYSTYWVGRFGH